MTEALKHFLRTALFFAGILGASLGISWLVGHANGQPIGTNTNVGSLTRLGSIQFTAAGPTAGPITFAPYRRLVIDYVITGYSGSDIGAFQFNGDATAADYGSWFAAMSNAATPLNSQTASNAGTIAVIPVSGTAITLGRVGRMIISNAANKNKVIDITTANESGTSTGPAIERGWGTWLNNTTQITQIQMMLVGANNLGAGSFAVVYGENP